MDRGSDSVHHFNHWCHYMYSGGHFMNHICVDSYLLRFVVRIIISRYA